MNWSAPILRELSAEDFGLFWDAQTDEDSEQFEMLRRSDWTIVGEVYHCERGEPLRTVAKWHCKTSDWREVVDEFDTPEECYAHARARLVADFIANETTESR